MKNTFRVGIDFLKKEGVCRFIARVLTWIPEFIIWACTMIKGTFLQWMYENDVFGYGWKLRYKHLKKDGKADSYLAFSTVMGGLEYCKKHNQPYEILNDGEKVEVVLPECFEERDDVRKKVFDSPPIYLTTFMNVAVYSATNLITKDDIAISDLYERDGGRNRYDITGGCISLSPKRKKWFRTVYIATDTVVEEAINCVGWACGNYYHFTYEILSRLAFVDRYEEYRSLPVLVDAVTMSVPQMKDLFDRVNVYQHPVIPVEKYTRIQVKKLVYVSRNMWMPPNFNLGVTAEEEDYFFSRSVVDNIRDRVLSMQDEMDGAVHRKIYLSRRKCSNQRLVNAVEIEQIFVEHGYHVVFPEELSFAQQVAVFHNADVIVGATGAAFTNMVYCHEGAKVGIIMPSENDPYPFSNIASMVKVRFIVLGADVVKRGWSVSLDTFALNKEKCVRFIEYLDECRD